MRKETNKTKNIPIDKKSKTYRKGGPQMFNGRPTSGSDVIKDIKKTGLGLSNTIIDSVSKAGSVVLKGIEGESGTPFQSKQNRIYNKKKDLDEYRNSKFLKDLEKTYKNNK